MPFRDVVEVFVKGGKGGDGALSFMRLKYIPKGGPDGGHGGLGGSVYLEATDSLNSLDQLITNHSYKGGTGMQGEGRNRNGLGGEDLVLPVPVGTQAIDVDTGELLADLVEVGQRVQVAAGGQGGRGNAAFANSRRRTPRFAERGSLGEDRRLRLELLTIADVGLVGYPNAGKSSLLTALSRARPKVADYPFTTLIPNLGVVEQHHERLTVADIPGIIEDAHLGKGLGLEFLRHISRTRLLVYVLDVADDPLVHMASLRAELEAFDPTLLDRPALVVLNKIDLVDAGEVSAAEELLADFGLPVFSVSCLQRQGLDALVEALFELLPPVPKRVARPLERRVVVEPVRVARDLSGLGWIVTGSDVEAVVARFDATNRDAVAYLQHHFAAMGVNKLLAKAGAKTGEEVQIGAAVFDYFDEAAAAAETKASEAEQEAEEAEAERRYLEEDGEDSDDGWTDEGEAEEEEDAPLPPEQPGPSEQDA